MKALAISLLCGQALAVACASVMWLEHKRAEAMTLAGLLHQAEENLDAHQYEAALKEATSALASPLLDDVSDYNVAQIHRVAGLAALALNQAPLAEEHLAQAAEYLWTMAAPYARAQMAAGHVHEAMVRLEAKQGGLDADGWAALAEARQKLGEKSAALEAANHALKLQPDSEAALRMKAALTTPDMVAAPALAMAEPRVVVPDLSTREIPAKLAPARR